MDKIAFVVQRYGLEVNGGSEMYCRVLAERLTAIYDVTVYTTCAVDYVTWKNEYPEGVEELNGVHVRHYANERERNQERFAEIYREIMQKPEHTPDDEENWIDEQGPFCPKAIDAIKEEYGEYRAVLFMTYLYYLTVRGMGLNLPNAVLIPTAHDEPPIYMHCFDQVFNNAKGIAWLTPEERAFARGRFPLISNTPEAMTGIGIDKPEVVTSALPSELLGQKYLIYAGRIDESKGCGEMFRYFQIYKKRNKDDLKLVLIGKEVLSVPKDPDIIYLGFVSEETKHAIMANAFALVLFSPFESLSIVVLESMILERPVIVTEKCKVLKGHCQRSNAGLFFANYLEFEGALNYLQNHPDTYQAMCKNGEKYTQQNYKWDVIIGKYRELIDSFNC